MLTFENVIRCFVEFFIFPMIETTTPETNVYSFQFAYIIKELEKSYQTRNNRKSLIIQKNQNKIHIILKQTKD